VVLPVAQQYLLQELLHGLTLALVVEAAEGVVVVGPLVILKRMWLVAAVAAAEVEEILAAAGAQVRPGMAVVALVVRGVLVLLLPPAVVALVVLVQVIPVFPEPLVEG
jgi:hypothetical protein